MFQDVGFLTGKTAMCVNGPWFQPFLADTRLAERYHLAAIPRGPAGRVTRVTWDGICMAPHLPPERRNAVWRFIRFVCSERAQRLLASTGRALPALRSAGGSFIESDPAGRAGKFVDALAYSRLQPVTLQFRAMDVAINRHLRSLLRDVDPVSPVECLTRLAADPDITKHFPATEPGT